MEQPAQILSEDMTARVPKAFKENSVIKMLMNVRIVHVEMEQHAETLMGATYAHLHQGSAESHVNKFAGTDIYGVKCGAMRENAVNNLWKTIVKRVVTNAN